MQISNDLDVDIKQIRSSWPKWGKQEKAAIFLVTIFILIFCIQNIVYISHDSYKFTDFQLVHSMKYYFYLIKAPDIPSSITYPPITYLVSMPYFYVLGTSHHIARISLTIFWIIFLLAMFGIGYQYGGYYSGFTVMALCGSSPHVLEYSRLYFLDFPQAATTAMAFYFLLKTNWFRNRNYSILFGFCISLAFLVKWSAIFFMIIPILWYVIPLTFKSIKTVKTFIPLLLSTMVSIAGTILYYKWIVRQEHCPNFWSINFILSIIIPTGILFLITRMLEGAYKNDDNYAGSAEQGMINFNYSTLPVIFYTGAWFSWAGRGIVSRYIGESYQIVKYNDYYKRFFEFETSLKTLFSFIIILFIIGMIFMIIGKRKDMIILIPSSIVSFYLVFQLATYDIDPTRYLFPIIIFIAPICGFWVKYLGKAEKYVTLGITLLSMVSILAWTVIPGDLPIYYPVKFRLILPGEIIPMSILCTEAPDTEKIDFSGVINSMAPEKFNKNRISYYTIFTQKPDQKFGMTIKEGLELEVIRTGKIHGVTGTEFDRYSNPKNIFIPDQLKEWGVANILLVSKDSPAPPLLIKRIRKHFKFTREPREINIGKNIRITVLNIDNVPLNILEDAPLPGK